MSSFICSAKHFNSIQSKTIELFLDHRFNAYPFNEEYKLYNRPKASVETRLKELFKGLRELNVVAYHFQYKNHYQGILDQEIQTSLKQINQVTQVKDLTYLGLYNGLTCLSYQIETEHLEGIREDLFFYDKFLAILTSQLAQFICSIMEDDPTNVWEIK